MPGKVLVLGAQGVIGSFVARALREAGWEVRRAGRRPEDASDFRLVDLDRQDTVDAACREVDLVVSSVHHPKLFAERAVLREGGVLLHLDDIRSEERERLRSEVPEPRGLVADRSGLGGVSGLALVEMLGDHPEADTIEGGFAVSIAEKAGPAGGRLVRRLTSGPPHHATATFELPEPFGPRRCIEAAPEATEQLMGEMAGGRTVRFYACFLPASFAGLLGALNGLRLLSRLPEAAFTVGRRKVPKDLSSQPTFHWARVLRGGEVLAFRFVRGNGDYRSTVGATVVFAAALVPQPGAGPARKGVFGVDQIFTLRELEPAFAERAISVERRPASPGAGSAADPARAATAPS